MEQKKSPQADLEQRRTSAFLLGLVFVLALCYVALEWNSGATGGDDFDPLALDDLIHESELVPMSNEETLAVLPEPQPREQGQQLRVVDDDVELTDEPLEGERGDDDEALLHDLEQQLDDRKALAAMGVDPANPLNFRVVEELPQYPGGAVEFMKWLTRHLRYPHNARRKKVEGKVVAVFYVEKDGSITGLDITQSLSPECDREALRVLRMMPDWKPGVQDNQPCRTKVCIPIVFKL